MFPQLGVIQRARNKFAEMVAAAEGYLIITHVKEKKKNQRSSRSEYAFL